MWQKYRRCGVQGAVPGNGPDVNAPFSTNPDLYGIGVRQNDRAGNGDSEYARMSRSVQPRDMEPVASPWRPIPRP